MPGIDIEPILGHPREAEPGRRYVFTVDVRLPVGAAWPDPRREEVTFYCMADAWPLFKGDSASEAVVLHRFGSSYGAARFVLTANDTEHTGTVSFTLTNEWGVPLTVLQTEAISVAYKRPEEPVTDEPLRQFHIDAGGVRGLAIPPESRSIAVWGENGICAYDLVTGEAISFPEGAGRIAGMAALKNGEIVCAAEQTLAIVGLAGGPGRTLAIFNSRITCLALDDDGATAAVALEDGGIGFVVVADARTEIHLAAPIAGIVSLAIDWRRQAVIVREDGSWARWNSEPSESGTGGRCVINSGFEFYLGREDGSVQGTQPWHGKMQGSPSPVTALLSIRHSPTQPLSLMIAGHENGTIDIHDPDYLCLLDTLHAHISAVRGLAFTENEIVSGSLNGTIRVWAAPRFGALELYHRRLANRERRKGALSTLLAAAVDVTYETYSSEKLELFPQASAIGTVGVCADESNLHGADFQKYSNVIGTDYQSFTWYKRTPTGSLEAVEQFALSLDSTQDQMLAFKAFLERGLHPPQPAGPSASASVRTFFPVFTDTFEGRVPFMYLDMGGQVRVAGGNLIDPAAEAVRLPFRFKNKPGVANPGSAATPAEISAEWRKIKNDSSLATRGFQACEPLTDLELSDETIDGLVQARLAANESFLKHPSRFPNFESWPADAQLGLLSMAWMIGPGGVTRFPKFCEACRALDFATAAAECNLSEAGNPGLSARDQAHRELFSNAAIVQAVEPAGRALHTTLFYPRVLTGPGDLPAPDAPVNVAVVLHDGRELELTKQLCDWLTSAGGFEVGQVHAQQLTSEGVEEALGPLFKPPSTWEKDLAFLFLRARNAAGGRDRLSIQVGDNSPLSVDGLLKRIVRHGYKRTVLLCEITGEVNPRGFGFSPPENSKCLLACLGSPRSGNLIRAFLSSVESAGQNSSKLHDEIHRILKRRKQGNWRTSVSYPDFSVSAAPEPALVNVHLRLPWHVTELELNGSLISGLPDLQLRPGKYEITDTFQGETESIDIAASLEGQEIFVFRPTYAAPFRLGVVFSDSDRKTALWLRSTVARSNPTLRQARIRFQNVWHDELLGADLLVIFLNRKFMNSPAFAEVVTAIMARPTLPVLLVRSEKTPDPPPIEQATFAVDGMPLSNWRADRASEMLFRQVDSRLRQALEEGGWFAAMANFRSHVFRVRPRANPDVFSTGFRVSDSRVIAADYAASGDDRNFELEQPGRPAQPATIEGTCGGIHLLHSEASTPGHLPIESRPPEIGERVMLLACMNGELECSQTPGEIAAVDEDRFEVRFAGEVRAGAGGGPIFDREGKVIGIEYERMSEELLHRALRPDRLIPWLEEHGVRAHPAESQVITSDYPVAEVVVDGKVTYNDDPNEKHGPYVLTRGTHQLSLPQSFHMGVYPVTNRLFLEFIKDGGYLHDELWNGRSRRTFLTQDGMTHGPSTWMSGANYPPEMGNHPVAGVSYLEAKVFVRWLQRRYPEQGWVWCLPSEDMWEMSARSPEGFQYPWGPQVLSGHANYRRLGAPRTTSDVRQFPQGNSPYGCADMAGNVWEFVETPDRLPSRKCVLRGGSFTNDEREIKSSLRLIQVPIDHRPSDFGFRCAQVPLLTVRAPVFRGRVRTGSDPDASLVNETPAQTTIEELISKQRPADMQNPAAFNPYQDHRAGSVETTIYEVEAAVILCRLHKSGSYQLVLRGETGQTMIANCVDPRFVDAASRWARQIAAVRREIDERRQHPASPWRVRVVGIGFFNRVHRQPGAAPNGIELTPVLSIEWLS